MLKLCKGTIGLNQNVLKSTNAHALTPNLLCTYHLKLQVSLLSSAALHRTFGKERCALKHKKSSTFRLIFPWTRRSKFSFVCSRHVSSGQRDQLWFNSEAGANTLTSSSKTSVAHDGRSMLERYIFVKTLVGFYEDIPDGAIFDSAYADSRPDDDYDANVPIIVGLHDTPGNHNDLIPILSTFAKLGCRTIAPTFPGHGNTQGLLRGFDDIFTQSTLEKAMYVQDFLWNLGIEKVDMIVGVGAGCYPTLRLCAGGDTSGFYKSMALVSPWPLNRPRYEPNPDMTRRIQLMWDRPFLRPPTKVLLSNFRVGNAISTQDKITAAYLINNLDLAEAASLAFTAVTLNIPRVVVFGELDEDVQKDLYLNLIASLDIPQTNIISFDGVLRTPSIPGALSFPNEGYEVFKKHPGIISAYLTHLVKLSRPHLRF